MGKIVQLTVAGQRQEVQVKEYGEQRVVTFRDIDKLHGRPEGTASRTFSENRRRMVSGEDYFHLTNEEIQATKIVNYSSPKGLILLTESGYLMLVKSLTDDLAWEVQRQLVNAYFRAKESFSQRLPRTYVEALEDLLNAERDKLQLQEQLQLQAPKVELYDILLSAKNAQTMNEVAKAFGWGRNKLFALLRDRDVLMRGNMPYQRYIDAGYFDVREVSTQRGDCTVNVTQTLVTPKGLDFIKRVLDGKSGRGTLAKVLNMVREAATN